MDDQRPSNEELRREVVKLRQRLELSETERTAELLKANERLSAEMRERRSTEETLRRSESRFRSLVENTNDVIWELDENNVFTYVSPKSKDMLGYEPEEAIGRTPFDFMSADEAERMEGAVREIIDSGQPFAELEAAFLRKDGRQVVLECGGKRISVGDQEHRGFRGISRDVTGRKKTEELLRQSEEQYRVIFESIADSLLVGDLEGRIVAANPAACEAHGYTQDEIIGLSAKELIHPDDRYKLDEFPRVVDAGDRYRVEAVEVRKDGSTFDVEVFGTPFMFKDQPHLLAIVRDVTDRKNAIEALRQSEEVTRALINAPTEVAFLIEKDGTILTLNETAAKRHGKTAADLVGTCIYDLLPPDLAESRGRRAEEVIRSRRAVRVEDEQEGRSYDSHVYPVFDASGEVVRLAIYGHDVTKRKRAEEALERETRYLKRSLEASDRDRRLIAYEIHDGLAQQLTSAMMQFQAFASLSSRDAERASNVFNAGLELLGEALAETRRLISGVRPPILDELGLVTAIEHLINGLGSESGPDIEFQADVEFDRLGHSLENGLFRIVQECVTNACKHSESNKVLVAMAQNGNTLRIEIQDWGLGFDLEGTEEGRFGLEGIRERTRLLGGRAIIDSSPDAGTRVAVELPLP
ncbi:MAG: PAS domain S-box protein [Planctomycetes bacterium]|nr:PAS domain S-box protein [Planctomycetota bacterium]